MRPELQGLQLNQGVSQNPQATHNDLLRQLLAQSLLNRAGVHSVFNLQDLNLLRNVATGVAMMPAAPVNNISAAGIQSFLNALSAGSSTQIPLMSASATALQQQQQQQYPSLLLQQSVQHQVSPQQEQPPVQHGAARAAEPLLPPRPNGTRSKLLYVPTDDSSVNAYQCFARKQIELFEATQDDVNAGAQGRNKPIVLGQVGIRCVHCAELHPRFRTRAAVYYPSRLSVMYQAAQNIVVSHLPELCESIPDNLREHLASLNNKRSSVGGGKNYWCDTARAQGVCDTENGLRFIDNPLPPSTGA